MRDMEWGARGCLPRRRPPTIGEGLVSGGGEGRRGPLGIGVIGVGQRGQRHLRFVREAGAGDVPVVAVADTHGPSIAAARAILAEGPGGADATRVYRD